MTFDSPTERPDDTPASAADRRRAQRRSGPFALLDVRGPRGEWWQGFVLDRSRSGLRLALTRPVEVGTELRLRALRAPDGAPWSEVVVRRAEAVDGCWELGCEYQGDLAWHARVLLE